ncbi:MAG: substrate-binding domain-containing protein, partial [Terriglobia bacterium]
SGGFRLKAADPTGAGLRSLLLLVAAVLLLVPAAKVGAQQALPWSQGKNDPALEQGYIFQVPGTDNVPDLHGNPVAAKLVLFIGGNQFMVLPKLVGAFVERHPEFAGKIFYETLPPGILLSQMQHQDTLTLGNLTLTVRPDVYEAGAVKLKMLASQRQVPTYATYASNDLAIMVRKGNPKHIRSLTDLGRAGVRLSMPNPQWEGVARLIENSLRKAGGAALVREVMVAKRRDGATFLTHVHHRQTALRIMENLSDAGVTWQSEVRFQERIGNPIEGVSIPERYNTTGIYAAGVLVNARHPQAGELWVNFLQSKQAQSIYRAFGFGPAPAKGQPDPTIPVVTLRPPNVSSIPSGPLGDLIRLGRNIILNTPQYAAPYTGNAMKCNDCHLKGGTVALASPLGGVTTLFPAYSARAGRVITIEDRLNECFVRSQNGKPVPDDSRDMIAMVAYMTWLSQNVPEGSTVQGRGLPRLRTPAR